MQSNNIWNLFGNTLTHKHVDYYICICYYQNHTLQKDEVNKQKHDFMLSLHNLISLVKLKQLSKIYIS